MAPMDSGSLDWPGLHDWESCASQRLHPVREATSLDGRSDINKYRLSTSHQEIWSYRSLPAADSLPTQHATSIFTISAPAEESLQPEYVLTQGHWKDHHCLFRRSHLIVQYLVCGNGNVLVKCSAFEHCRCYDQRRHSTYSWNYCHRILPSQKSLVVLQTTRYWISCDTTAAFLSYQTYPGLPG